MALLMNCFVLLVANGKFRCGSAGVLSIISHTILKRTRVCGSGNVSPRKLLDAVPTVTRILVNFYINGLLVRMGSVGRGLRHLFLVKAVLAFLKFLLDCNYPVGGGV